MKRPPLIIVGSALALIAGAAIASSAARAARLGEVPAPSLSASDAAPSAGASMQASPTEPSGSDATKGAPVAGRSGQESPSDAGASEHEGSTNSQSRGPVVEPQPSGGEQITTIPAAVAASRTGALTDQVVAVVASGSTAQVHLLNRRSAGSWDDEWASSGLVSALGLGSAGPGTTAAPAGSWPLLASVGFEPGGSQLPFNPVSERSCWVLDEADPERGSLSERDVCSAPSIRLADQPDAFRFALTIGAPGHASGAGPVSFVHVGDGSGQVAGVALPQSTMSKLMRAVRPGAHIVIANSIQELATY